MRILFVKRKLAYPRSSGHDVHTWELMRALALLGHEVSFAALGAVDKGALEGLSLTEFRDLSGAKAGSAGDLRGLQERFRRYWGIEPALVQAVGDLVDELAFDAVVLSGLDILPCVGSIRGAVRVWYAGDEWVRHHLSLVKIGEPNTWGNVKTAFVKGVYEWAFGDSIDRVWVVSEPERWSVRLVMHRPHVDVVPNGVDVGHYAPQTVAEKPMSACFWGRLDFEPNIDAVVWFCREVWPRIWTLEARATLTIYGFQPTSLVEQVCKTTPGVVLVANLPDLRREISSQSIVVLPFLSGGGIKNKLLEAAALAKPIVASPKACEGLQMDAPILVATQPEQWVSTILGLWRNDEQRRQSGQASREWVTGAHSWTSAAQVAARGIESTLLANRRS